MRTDEAAGDRPALPANHRPDAPAPDTAPPDVQDRNEDLHMHIRNWADGNNPMFSPKAEATHEPRPQQLSKAPGGLRPRAQPQPRPYNTTPPATQTHIRGWSPNDLLPPPPGMYEVGPLRVHSQSDDVYDLFVEGEYMFRPAAFAKLLLTLIACHDQPVSCDQLTPIAGHRRDDTTRQYIAKLCVMGLEIDQLRPRVYQLNTRDGAVPVRIRLDPRSEAAAVVHTHMTPGDIAVPSLPLLSEPGGDGMLPMRAGNYRASHLLVNIEPNQPPMLFSNGQPIFREPAFVLMLAHLIVNHDHAVSCEYLLGPGWMAHQQALAGYAREMRELGVNVVADGDSGWSLDTVGGQLFTEVDFYEPSP